jgi:hypothetical protein
VPIATGGGSFGFFLWLFFFKTRRVLFHCTYVLVANKAEHYATTASLRIVKKEALPKELPTIEGYEFTGWYETPENAVADTNRVEFPKRTDIGFRTVHYYAGWRASAPNAPASLQE